MLWCSYHLFNISAQSCIKASLKLNYYAHICYFITATITHRPSIKAVCCPACTNIGKEVSPKNYTHLPQQTEISSIQNKAQLLTKIIKLWSIPSQDGGCQPFASERITSDGFQSSFAGNSCPPQPRTRLGDWCECAEEWKKEKQGGTGEQRAACTLTSCVYCVTWTVLIQTSFGTLEWFQSSLHVKILVRHWSQTWNRGQVVWYFHTSEECPTPHRCENYAKTRLA